MSRLLQNHLTEHLSAVLKNLYLTRQTRLFPRCGICNNVAANCYFREDKIDEILMEVFSHWPNFSGDIHYPVPHPRCSPMEGYEISRRTSLWDPETEYGKARFELLEFSIKYLEKILEDRKDHEKH